MRLFISIYLDESLLNEATAAQEQLKASLNSKQRAALRFVKRDRMHITLKFLGEVDSQTYEKIEERLVTIQRGAAPFSLTLNGTGCFPVRGPASIAWLGISSSKDTTVDGGGLYGLQGTIEAQISPLGYPPEFPSYIPHLTIGYIQGRNHAEEIRTSLKTVNPTPLTQSVTCFSLVESKLSGENTGHQILRNFTF